MDNKYDFHNNVLYLSDLLRNPNYTMIVAITLQMPFVDLCGISLLIGQPQYWGMQHSARTSCTFLPNCRRESPAIIWVNINFSCSWACLFVQRSHENSSLSFPASPQILIEPFFRPCSKRKHSMFIQPWHSLSLTFIDCRIKSILALTCLQWQPKTQFHYLAMHQTGKKLIQDIKCSQFTVSSYAGWEYVRSKVFKLQQSVIKHSSVFSHKKIII